MPEPVLIFHWFISSIPHPELLFCLVVVGTMLIRIPVIAEVIHLSLVYTGKQGLK
jgi:hypothetical protein